MKEVSNHPPFTTMKQTVLIFVIATVAARSSAAQAATASGSATPPMRPPPTVCVNDPERHRFDFWIGEWNVTTQGGTTVGSSVIQSVSGGCALLENWSSASG